MPNRKIKHIVAKLVGASTEETLDVYDVDAVHTDQIANNVTTTTAGYVLDARQGKSLNDTLANKFNTANVVNNLTTTTATYALDARQGKALADRTETLESWKTRVSTFNTTNKAAASSLAAWSSTTATGTIATAGNYAVFAQYIGSAAGTGSGYARFTISWNGYTQGVNIQPITSAFQGEMSVATYFNANVANKTVTATFTPSVALSSVSATIYLKWLRLN